MKKIFIFTLIFVLSIFVFSFSMEFAGAALCDCEIDEGIGEEPITCKVRGDHCPSGLKAQCSSNFGQCLCGCVGESPEDELDPSNFNSDTADCLSRDVLHTIIDLHLFKFYAKALPCVGGADPFTIPCPHGYKNIFRHQTECTDGNEVYKGICLPGCGRGCNRKGWQTCIKEVSNPLVIRTDTKPCSIVGTVDEYGRYYYAGWKRYDGGCEVAVLSCGSWYPQQGICPSNCDNDWDNGCEVNACTDSNNCGFCGHKCNANAFCNYRCNCNSGFNNCDNSWDNGCEVNVLNDMNNCGECDNNCVFKHMTSCQNGECTGCESGWGNCDGDLINGCETEVLKNTDNCGSCNNKCSSGYSCKEGSCLYGSFSKAIHFVHATGRIENNQILIEKGALPEARYDGIYLDSCKNVEINKNKIKAMSEGDIGIYIIDSEEIILNENEIIASANAVALSKSIPAIEITEFEEEIPDEIKIQPISGEMEIQPMPEEEPTLSIPLPFQPKPEESTFEVARILIPTKEGLEQQPSEKSITPSKPIPKPLTIDITLNSNLMCANGIDFESKHGGLITGNGNTFTESSKNFLENFKIKECSPVEINSCQDLELDSTIYALTKDIEVDGTCFNIQGKDIILNCQGKKIKYAQNAEGYGINIKDGEDVTVTNCVFEGPREQEYYGEFKILKEAVYIDKGQDIKILNNEFSGGGGVSFIDVGSTDSDETIISSNIFNGGSIYGTCKDASELYSRIQNMIGPSILRNKIAGGRIEFRQRGIQEDSVLCGSPLIQLNKITNGGARGVGAIQTNVPCNIYGNEIISPVAIGIVANYNQGLWEKKPWLFPIVGIAGNIVDIPEIDGNKIGMHLNDLTKTRVEDNVVVNKGAGAGVRFHGHFKEIYFERNIVCKEFKGEGSKGDKGDYNDIDCFGAVEFMSSESKENVFSTVMDKNKCRWISEEYCPRSQFCDCEVYDSQGPEPYCGDKVIQGEDIYGENYGEECENHSDCIGNDRCIFCQCVAPHEPSNTLCFGSDGYSFYGNQGKSHFTCEMFNVISNPFWPNFLDYVIDDALDCCGPIHGIISPYHRSYCKEASKENTVRDCLKKFISEGLSDGIRSPTSGGNKVPWCQSYYIPELCCFGGNFPLCSSYGGTWGKCSPDKDLRGTSYNSYVLDLTCLKDDCCFYDQPAFYTATILNTGTCADWSILFTTLLRKTGYFESEGTLRDKVYTIYNLRVKHAYNLVWSDQAEKWVFMHYGELISSEKIWLEGYCRPPNSIGILDSFVASDNLMIKFDNNPEAILAWREFAKNNILGCEEI